VSRREFITLLGGAVAAWPLFAQAQQAALPVVGFLNTATSDGYARMAAAFRQGLNEGGYIEGRNFAFEYRWAENQPDRLPRMAEDLVRHGASVIFAGGNTDAALAAQRATSTIPIVFAMGGDPVELGLVASLNRPGGNITGVTFLATALGPKKLELLSAVVPTAKTIGMIMGTTVATADAQLRDAEAAARTLGLQIHVVRVSTDQDFETAFTSLNELRAGGLVIGADAFLNSRRDLLVALAARHSIPTVYPWREAVTTGGLMSYGASVSEAYRQAGIYAARILKGEKSTDLPVQQSSKVELAINLKTAKTLGLIFPLTLLGRADEVIE
jgi:putative tryptophan/tyrosine transport system substrate-binding protein